MIIWNGLIAQAFHEYSESLEVCIFASGVSNSQEKKDEAFLREITLLQEVLWKIEQNTLFIYISTSSIDDPAMKDSLYVKHKKNAEKIIQESGKTYCIIRTTNPVWNTKNPYTLLNFLYHSIKNEIFFELWEKAERNFIDINDFVSMTRTIIRQKSKTNQIITLANTRYFRMVDVVKIFEWILWKKAHYSLQEKSSKPEIDTTLSQRIAQEIGISFDEHYLERLIQKYYSSSN